MTPIGEHARFTYFGGFEDMFFNGFLPSYTSTVPAWGRSPVGGGFNSGWWGHASRGMSNCFGNWSMGRTGGWMSNWWQRAQCQHPRPLFSHHHHHHHHGAGPAGCRPPVEPTTAQPAAITTPATPASAQTPVAPAAPASPASTAPKEGSWNNSANGYMVGQSGELQVRAADFGSHGNFSVQYRATDGVWTTLGTGAELQKKGTAMIQAKPNDKVEFRVYNPVDQEYLSTTTGKTPLGVWPSTDGTMIGACDFKLFLSDPNAKG